MTTSLSLDFAGHSHVGLKRSQNQDSYLCVPDLSTFVIADGMGGHKGGETASLLAVTTVCDSIRSASSSIEDPRQLIKQAIAEANSAVFGRAQTEASLQGMGTTCTALLFRENTVYIGHVGDSRCYLVHPQKIWQLTKDHSLVAEKLRAGLISRDQLKTDKMKNIITRSVGFEANVEIDVYQLDVYVGDTFLLCSDGLSGLCDDQQISRIITRSVFQKKNLEAATLELCQAANENGGDDNVTAVLVKIG